LTEYILEEGQKYNIKAVAVDNFRYALMRDALEKIGFDPKERKNLYLVRPSDIMKVQPVIDSCFNKQLFIWGDNPALRWATNNTKLVRSGKKEGTDTGNFYYAKIEAKSRKTDPFMALVASMVIEDRIDDSQSAYDDLPVIT
jgi:phage terminase large subunit-like protein